MTPSLLQDHNATPRRACHHVPKSRQRTQSAVNAPAAAQQPLQQVALALSTAHSASSSPWTCIGGVLQQLHAARMTDTLLKLHMQQQALLETLVESSGKPLASRPEHASAAATSDSSVSFQSEAYCSSSDSGCAPSVYSSPSGIAARSPPRLLLQSHGDHSARAAGSAASPRKASRERELPERKDAGNGHSLAATVAVLKASKQTVAGTWHAAYMQSTTLKQLAALKESLRRVQTNLGSAGLPRQGAGNRACEPWQAGSGATSKGAPAYTTLAATMHHICSNCPHPEVL